MSEIREGNIILTYETRRAEEYIRTVQASAKATRELEDAIEDAQKDAGNIGGAADKVRPGLAKFSNSLQSVRKTALGVFAGNLITAGVQAIGRGLGGLVSGAAASAIAFEQTKVSFETFLGSAEAAEQVLSDLNEFSLSTPFEPTQVQEAGKALLAFGVEQEKLIPTLRAVGDISAGTGKDFNELAVIFGKARVQGTLFAEDINQLTEAGVPVIQKFAKQLGVTEGEVKKLASEGAISFENLEEAFISLTSEGGKFFELTARQSQTDGGLISTLRGVGNEVLKSIGQAFLPFLREGVVLLIRVGNAAKEFVEENAAPAFNFLVNVTRPLIEAVRSLFSNINEGTGISDGLTTAFRALGGVIEVVVGAITFLINGFNTLINQTRIGAAAFNFIKEAVSDTIFVLSNLPSIFVGIVAAGRQAATNLGNFFTLVALEGQALLKDLEGLVSESARIQADALRAQADAIRASGRTAAQAFTDAFNEDLARRTDLTKSAEDPEVPKAFNAAGQRAAEEFGKGQREGISKEAQKALEQRLKDEEKAAENILRLQAELIENATERKIALIRLNAAKEIKSVVGTEDQKVTQRILIEQQANDEIFKLRSEALQKLQQLEQKVLSDSTEFIEQDEAQREANFIAASARQRQQRALAAEELILNEKEILARREQTEAEAAINIQRIQLDSLKSELDNLDLSAEERIKLKQQIVDAEIALEKALTDNQKQEIEARNQALKQAADSVFGFAKQAADEDVAQQDRRVQAQQDRVNSLQRLASQGNAEQLQLEEERLQKIQNAQAAAQRRQAAITSIQIAADTAGAVSSGIAGVTRAFATGGPVAGIGAGISLAATIGSSILAIRNAFAGIGSFATGTRGLTMQDGIPGPSSGIIIEAHKDERIMKAAQSKELRHLSDDQILDKVRFADALASDVYSDLPAQIQAIGVSPSLASIPGYREIHNRNPQMQALLRENQLLREEMTGVRRRLDKLNIQFSVNQNGIHAAITKYSEAQKHRRKQVG